MTSPAQAPETQRFADLNDAVDYAPRSRMTILRALRQGGLPGSHAGRTSPWVIKWNDLIAWVEAGCPVTKTPQDAPASTAEREGVITSCDAPRTGGGDITSGVAVATRTHHGDATRAAS